MPTSSNKRRLQRTDRFGRDVRSLPTQIQKAAFEVAVELSENIFSPSLHVKKLTGFRGFYRVAVVRDYRLVFSFDEESVYLLRIAHRRDIYRDLEL